MKILQSGQQNNLRQGNKARKKRETVRGMADHGSNKSKRRTLYLTYWQIVRERDSYLNYGGKSEGSW